MSDWALTNHYLVLLVDCWSSLTATFIYFIQEEAREE